MRIALVLALLLIFTPLAHAAPAADVPVEEAIQQVMGELSQDAQNDMKDTMKDMEKDRLKKRELREGEKKLKDDLSKEREAAKRRRLEERLARLKAEREAAEKRQQARLDRLRHRREEEKEARNHRRDDRQTRHEQQEEKHRRLKAEREARARERLKQQKAEQDSKPQTVRTSGKKNPCPNPNIDCHHVTGTLKSSTVDNGHVAPPHPAPAVTHDTAKNSIGNVR